MVLQALLAIAAQPARPARTDRDAVAGGEASGVGTGFLDDAGDLMWLQMRLNPQMPDPVQRQIFALMPWVLMFVMASFASGLQLYWVTNNLLTIAQQKWLYSKHPQLRVQPST